MKHTHEGASQAVNISTVPQRPPNVLGFQGSLVLRIRQVQRLTANKLKWLNRQQRNRWEGCRRRSVLHTAQLPRQQLLPLPQELQGSELRMPGLQKLE